MNNLSTHAVLKGGRLMFAAVMGAFLWTSVGHAQDGKAPEFLRFGKPLNQQFNKLGKRELQLYERAFASFQNVDHCVVVDKSKPSYGNSKMRWKRLNTLEKVNWCVFLLAAKLNDHEQMLHWFNSNGFNATLIKQSPSVMRFHDHDGDGFIVSASVAIGESPIPVGLLDRLLAHSISIGLTVTSEGEPRSVRTHITRI